MHKEAPDLHMCILLLSSLGSLAGDRVQRVTEPAKQKSKRTDELWSDATVKAVKRLSPMDRGFRLKVLSHLTMHLNINPYTLHGHGTRP